MSNTEARIGFAFNNPDLTSNYHAPRFGLLVSPDDIRYDQMAGNPLIAEQNSQAYVDEQLLDCARLGIAYMERELNIDILPRRVRYQGNVDGNGNEVVRADVVAADASLLSQMNDIQKYDLYVEELGYPYRLIHAKHEMMVKLRRRPVRDVLTASFVDPYFSNKIIDLMPYRLVKKGLSGICYFRPKMVPGRGLIYSSLFSTMLLQPWYKDLHNVILIDYDTGYENAAAVPGDLRQIIVKVAARYLLHTFSEAKVAGITSRSVSLNSVSESITTPMSAENAFFGARLRWYDTEINEWLKHNRSKYSRTVLGAL